MVRSGHSYFVTVEGFDARDGCKINLMKGVFCSMAHFEKYTKAASWQVLEHDKHTRDGEHIDKTKTAENYNLCEVVDPWKEVKTKLADAKKSGARINSRTVALVSCVVTLPKDYKGDQRQFFEECKKYLDKLFGAENCVSAVVHMDEKTPHLHYKFCPIVKEGDVSKFNAKALISRNFLKSFHANMEKHLAGVLGRPVGIVNGATSQGNQTIKQLKALSEVTARLDSARKDLDNLLDEYNEEVDAFNKLLDEVDELQHRAKKLRDISQRLEAHIKDLKKEISNLEGEEFAPIFNNKDRIGER